MSLRIPKSNAEKRYRRPLLNFHKENQSMSKKNGFTLIELLIVVVIIGVLASMVIPRFRGHTEKARVAEAVMFLGQMRKGELQLYNTTGGYRLIPLPPGAGNSDPTSWNQATGMAPPDYTQPNSYWRYGAFTTPWVGCPATIGATQPNGYVQAQRWTGPGVPPQAVPRNTYPRGSIILCYDGTWSSAGVGGGDYATGSFLAPSE